MNYQNLAIRGAKTLRTLLSAFIATVHKLLRSAQMVSSNDRTLRPHLLSFFMVTCLTVSELNWQGGTSRPASRRRGPRRAGERSGARDRGRDRGLDRGRDIGRPLP